MKFAKIFSIILLLTILPSCAKKKPAPVVMLGNVSYDHRTSHNKDKNKRNIKSVNLPGYTVLAGDTIYSVARKNQVVLRDLIDENHLQPPYTLKVGTTINLPKVKYHQIASGDTVYSISRKYDMNVNNLIALNNLQSPFILKVGERIKVNNSTNATNVSNPRVVATKNSVSEHDLSIREENNSPTSNPTSIKSKQPKIDVNRVKLVEKNNTFIWPVQGPVISKFGSKAGGLYNDGINIRAKNDDKVKSVEDGLVAYVGNELRGYGNLIIIKHSGGWISAYAHLGKSKVSRGDKVKKGEVIAYVGSTGNVKSPQLYFGLRKGREAVNPELYLARNFQPIGNSVVGKARYKLKS